MSKLKSILIEFEECEANAQHIHPTIFAALSAMRPPEPPTDNRAQTQTKPKSVSVCTEQALEQSHTVWGLYANGVLTDVYLHKETADYEAFICRFYEHEHGVRYPDDAYDYEVRPIALNIQTVEQLRGETI